MDYTSSRWLPIVLLTCSNVFMTFAWYGHLKFKSKPLLLVILVSWGIAFFEYLLQVPANRWGSNIYSAYQLKILQEIITLAVFVVFALLYFGVKGSVLDSHKVEWVLIMRFFDFLLSVQPVGHIYAGLLPQPACVNTKTCPFTPLSKGMEMGLSCRLQAAGPGSGARGKTFPHFHRQQAEEDEGKLADDEEHQPAERRVGEAVAVQADAEHVDAEP
jgi:uncharacterized protein (DUF486 family)